MAHLNHNRSKLLLGCGTAALAIGLAMAPERAAAQAIQATENVTSGGANRVFTGTGTETIVVQTDTAVIEWTPDEDGAGNALDFLPLNNAVTFQNGVNNADFAVLNIIFPSANDSVTVFNGTVISQLIDLGTGAVSAGGTVAFYSPSGIFVGESAVFDVGNLILTTLEPDQASFDDFALNGGQLQLSALDPNGQTIFIDTNAQFTASAENSYFAVIGLEIQMLGTSDINGSQAYIAGEAVNISVSNGLFDIEIPVGTTAGTPIVLDGDIGGPSSTGITDDNHIIYAVAAAQTDPISMIFRGNLGFDPAASAGIVNGEIILSANYNVSGRTVNGGTLAQGANALFDDNANVSDAPGSIFMEDFISTSGILAVANEEVQVTAFNAASSIDGDLVMYGRNFSELTASNGQMFDITGNVFVSADAFGDISFDPTNLDAFGGEAFIDAFGGGVMNITGNASVSARAVGGVDLNDNRSGNATGGRASIASNGGQLTITGSADVGSGAEAALFNGDFLFGASFLAGVSQLFTTQGGQVTIGGDVDMSSDAIGTNGSTVQTSTSSQTTGGLIAIQTINDGSTINLNGDLTATANAIGGIANELNQGPPADAGEVFIVANNNSTITIQNDVAMSASALGINNAGGPGGDALGGAARIFVPDGGTVNLGGNFTTFAVAIGGQGTAGGNAFGGLAGASVGQSGLIDIADNVLADASATGGDASIGNGGDGGRGEGGNAFLQAVGSLTSVAALNIGGGADLNADGTGGVGGTGDGSVIGAGRGGGGFGGRFDTPNQADTNFNSGAFLLAGGDNGNITLGAPAVLSANGVGGQGGQGGLGQPGGDGGNGTGGTAQAGLGLIGGNGSVGQGTVDFGNVDIIADGTGGDGGIGTGTGAPLGNGGIGQGGDTFFTARAGTVNRANVDMSAVGTGGFGSIGGIGFGGLALVQVDFGATANVAGLIANAEGVGSDGDDTGGEGTGGQASVVISDGQLDVDTNLALFADGTGRDGGFNEGGVGNGGIAEISIDGATSSLGVVDTVVLSAEARGGLGSSISGGADATGGQALILLDNGAAMSTGGEVFLGTDAFGGINVTGVGGIGIGGGSTVDVLGDSTLTVGDNLTAEARASGGDGQQTGGAGFGGFAGIRVGDGVIDVTGNVVADASAAGGGAPDLGSDGGNGHGGFAGIFAAGTQTQNGTITIGGDASAIANGRGGNGGDGDGASMEAGRGGDGFGGDEADVNAFDDNEFNGAFIVAGGDNGTLTVGGTTLVSSVGTGGDGGESGGTGQDGADGGTGTGGTSTAGLELIGTNGTVGAGTASFGDIAILADGLGGAGRTNANGGDALGGIAQLVVSDADALTAGSADISADAVGGDGPGDMGGNATGGEAILEGMSSAATFAGQLSVTADATGGMSLTGGNAQAGLARIDVSDFDLNIAQDANGNSVINISSFARGGDGDTVGDANADIAELLLADAVVNADTLNMIANADASPNSTVGNGGEANAGTASATIIGGSQVNIAGISIQSNATTIGDEIASAGTVLFGVNVSGTGSGVFADLMDVEADASGGDQNFAGRFVVNVENGVVALGDFEGTALGDTVASDQLDSTIIGNAGSFLVDNNLNVFVFDDFTVETGQGGTVGGPDQANATANVFIESGRTITVQGDDDAFVGFVGDTIGLNSSDISIEDGARIGANTVNLTSLNRSGPAILGGGGTPDGTVAGEGYAAIAEELNRIEATNLNFTQTELPAAGTDDPDIEVRDATLQGTIGGGISNFNIAIEGTDGIIRVEGLFTLDNSDLTDSLTMQAVNRIEVVTPGGIRVLSTDGAPTGTLFLGSNNVWVADSNIIAQLQDNRNFAGRDDQLRTAASGSDDPLGFLRGGTVNLEIGESLLVRNTGTTTEQGGILVGDGGLSIFFGSATNSEGDLDVFAYGARIDDQGNLITGEDFFNEVNFNNGGGTGSTTYLDLSEFNDCIINTGECPNNTGGGGTPIDPGPDNSESGNEIPEPINNPIVIEDPIVTVAPVPTTEAETDSGFGIDFPGLLEEPEDEDEGNIDDPVSSGGDSSLYGQSGTVQVEGN